MKHWHKLELLLGGREQLQRVEKFILGG